LETPNAPLFQYSISPTNHSALDDEDDDEYENEALTTDQVFVATEMIGSDVAVTMKAETESFVNCAELSAVSFTV
jgi:hypothetical protein